MSSTAGRHGTTVATTRRRRPAPSLGHQLRAARTDAGLTQAQLATRAGIRRQLLSDLERDEVQLWRLEWLRSLADGLGVEVPALIDWAGVPSLAPPARGARTRARQQGTARPLQQAGAGDDTGTGAGLATTYAIAV